MTTRRSRNRSTIGSFTAECRRAIGAGGRPAGIGEGLADCVVEDAQGIVAQRYDGQPGTVYLIRPDQHVAARWRRFDAAQVQTALSRALKLN